MVKTFWAMCAFIVAVPGIAAAASGGSEYAGSKADIAGVRAIVAHDHGAQVLGAHVVGDYALIQWAKGYASQPEIYHRITGEKWKVVMTGGGGPMMRSAMLKGGIAEPLVRRLCGGWPTGNAKCMDIVNGKEVPWPGP